MLVDNCWHKIIEKDNIIEDKIKNIDILNITPLEALNFIYELKKEIDKKNNWK